MNIPLKTCLFAVNVVAAVVLLARPAAAQRPSATQVMPYYTLGVVRIADAPLLAERFRDTSIGRIAQDPQMKPLVGQLFHSVQEAFKQVEGQIGLSLDQILKLPQGEVCVGFVAHPDFEQEPGFIAVFDAKDGAAQARMLLDRAAEFLASRGGARGTEQIGRETVDVYTSARPGRLFSVERDGVFYFATSKPLMETVLANLSGMGVEKTLAENDKYITVMNRCLTAGEEQPHVTWYADPIAIVRRLASGSLAATGLALFPALGLDGLQAVGGTMTYSTGDYDQVQHFHLLLDNPRIGVLEAIGLKPGDTTPESWVPGDCISYATVHWDFRHTLSSAARLVNGIMGEGALEQQLRTRISEPLGADFEKEIVPLLSGRVTYVQWVEKPVRINSIATLVGVQLNDPKAAAPVLEKVMHKYGDRVERQIFGRIDYWSVKNVRQRQREGGPELRQPLPCIGIVGDTLLMTDSLKAFQEAITAQSDPQRSLQSALDFKLIASKIKRQRGGDAPGAIQFQRPEEGLRFWYDLAQAQSTRDRLSRQASRNRFFGAVDQALKDNPLPPFSVLAEYMAPGGGLVVNDDTGIHYSTFNLKGTK
jgi:hypothetical protein